MWKQPWLLCSVGETVCRDQCDVATGRCDQVCNNPDLDAIECTGIMDREKWMNPSTRVTETISAFVATIKAKGGNSMIQDMNVCDLDATLSKLCWIYRLHEVLCLKGTAKLPVRVYQRFSTISRPCSRCPTTSSYARRSRNSIATWRMAHAWSRDQRVARRH